MGLDITAYANIRPVAQARDFEEYDELYGSIPNTFYVERGEYDFPDHFGSLVPGTVYYEDRSDEDRAGAWLSLGYTSYGQFRDAIAQMVYGLNQRAVITQVPPHPDSAPFLRLLFFTDCDGWIGPEICADLAYDFETYDAQARTELGTWYGTYQKLARMFRYAADQGCIRYG